jgi:NADH-quinone oxidoreductase subunit J
MIAFDILFYAFAVVAVISAILVIFLSNPVYSALFLALTMSVLGAIFFTLEAYFVSVAQITVYAGAVMVLFVMVVMLFDLKHDQEEVFKISPINIVKLLSTALLCGFLVGTSWLAVTVYNNQFSAEPAKVAAVNSNKPEDEDLTSAEKSALVENPVTTETAMPEEFGSTVSLSKILFTNYVFEFEAVSILLLIAIVGAVALAKSRGGTHHVG